MKAWSLMTSLALAILILSACSAPAATDISSELPVLVSTNILGDVVKRVGGDWIDASVLMPVGADPHTFEPRPQDIAAISEAKVVFINGLGLEEALDPILDANVQGSLVEVSQGIETLPFIEEHADEEPGQEEQPEHAAGDPHTWTDPNNVMIWVRNIEAALSAADPAHAETYKENARAYTAELEELDRWTRSEIEKIPAQRRKLVTDHAIFGYFAQEYGLEQVGLVVPSSSTNASPSAQELAALEDTIRQQAVPAVFVGTTVSPDLAEQVANDTGAKLVLIYTESLSEAGGEADTYLKFMRYNVGAIVEALK